MMKPAERVDVIIEAIEVYLNQILYLRDLYPSQIFKKRRIYNAPVYSSIFPPLNTYLHSVLQAARHLLSQGVDACCDLRRLELVFYTGEHNIFERHMFELLELNKKQEYVDDSFLIYFEEELRRSLYEIPERMKLLQKLPQDTKMKILLYTSQNGQVKLSNHPHYQEFPWLQDNEEAANDDSKKWYILPLTSVHRLGLNLISEVCNV